MPDELLLLSTKKYWRNFLIIKYIVILVSVLNLQPRTIALSCVKRLGLDGCHKVTQDKIKTFVFTYCHHKIKCTQHCTYKTEKTFLNFTSKLGVCLNLNHRRSKLINLVPFWRISSHEPKRRLLDKNNKLYYIIVDQTGVM